MTTIWKYILPITDVVEVRMPAGARVLPHVHLVGSSDVAVWAVVDPAARLETRRFRIVGTGHPLDETDPSVYVGTVHVQTFIFHVFTA